MTLKLRCDNLISCVVQCSVSSGEYTDMKWGNADTVSSQVEENTMLLAIFLLVSWPSFVFIHAQLLTTQNIN